MVGRTYRNKFTPTSQKQLDILINRGFVSYVSSRARFMVPLVYKRRECHHIYATFWRAGASLSLRGWYIYMIRPIHVLCEKKAKITNMIKTHLSNPPVAMCQIHTVMFAVTRDCFSRIIHTDLSCMTLQHSKARNMILRFQVLLCSFKSLWPLWPDRTLEAALVDINVCCLRASSQ